MTQKALAARLQTEENTIENGLQTFVEVGMALTRIRDQKLWMAGGKHPSFEGYCKTRWGWSRNYADRVTGAAQVVKQIEKAHSKPAKAENVPIGTTLPTNEAQARPLAKLPEDEQPEAWAEAVEESKAEGKPVTAAKVGEVVARRMKPEEAEDWQPVKDSPKPDVDALKGGKPKKPGAEKVGAKDRTKAYHGLRAVVQYLDAIGKLKTYHKTLDEILALIEPGK